MVPLPGSVRRRVDAVLGEMVATSDTLFRVPLSGCCSMEQAPTMATDAARAAMEKSLIAFMMLSILEFKTA